MSRRFLDPTRDPESSLYISPEQREKLREIAQTGAGSLVDSSESPAVISTRKEEPKDS